MEKEDIHNLSGGKGVHGGVCLDVDPIKASQLSIDIKNTDDAYSLFEQWALVNGQGKDRKGESSHENGDMNVDKYGIPNNLPVVIVLDGIHDPMNYGSIIRSSYFLGASAVVSSLTHSCPPSAVASRASAG